MHSHILQRISFLPFTGGSIKPKRNIEVSSTYVLDYDCQLFYSIHLYAGPLRSHYHRSLNDYCNFDAYGFNIVNVFNIASLVANFSYSVFLLVSGLHKEKRNHQVLGVNLAGIIVYSCFIYYFSYRLYIRAERVVCLLGIQLLVLAANFFTFSLLSLSVDCCVAVFKPLKYRFIVTKSRILTSYFCVFIFGLVFFIIYPLLAFGTMYDGWLLDTCSWMKIVPINYIVTCVAISVFLNVCIVFF